jgi:hypothetical protein
MSFIVCVCLNIHKTEELFKILTRPNLTKKFGLVRIYFYKSKLAGNSIAIGNIFLSKARVIGYKRATTDRRLV